MPRNFLKAGFGAQRPMSNIPGSFLWILLTVLAAAAVPFCNVSTTPVVETPPPPPPPPPNVVTVETRIATEGHDSHQRSLPFTVYVLSQQLSWKLESATDLEAGQTLGSSELVEAINGAREVFCVGTASFEGAPPLEEARAAQRAATLARWVAPMIRDPSQTRIFALNAGQYRGPSELNSSYQRKAVIIVAGRHDEGVDLSEGLASGLKQQQREFPVVYSLLHHYSRSAEWLKVPNGPGGANGRSNPNANQLAGSRVRP